MRTATEALIVTLRQARRRKGWSQRVLSQNAGLTQAHISKLENGAADPKLTTFVELARLLDLEPVLVPRSALSAVQALAREAEATQEARSYRGALNTLHQLVRFLRTERPKDAATTERLMEVILRLNAIEPLVTPIALTELLDVTQQLQAAAQHQDSTGLKKGVERLAQLRNQLVHASPEAQRPAYSLDDED